MDAPSATDELKALELARSRLEAALASDENWRALTRPVADDPRPGAAMARVARNNRLKMALADNELYRAWKHVDDAITALRAKQASAAAPPQGADEATQPAPEAQGQPAPEAQGQAAQAAARIADVAPRVPGRLMRRLEAVQPRPAAPAAAAAATSPGAGRGTSDRNRARPPQRKAPPAPPPEPAEATVTFVVREEAPDRPLPAAEPVAPDAARDASPSDLRRRLEDAPHGQRPPPLTPEAAEAEVTIFSADGAREHREAEERASIVRRFRKALSGD